VCRKNTIPAGVREGVSECARGAPRSCTRTLAGAAAGARYADEDDAGDNVKIPAMLAFDRIFGAACFIASFLLLPKRARVRCCVVPSSSSRAAMFRGGSLIATLLPV